MTTAAEAYYGTSLSLTPSADVRLRLPKLPGLCRYYSVAPTAGGLKLILPDSRLCDTGGAVYTLVNRHASNSIGVYLNDATTLLFTLAADTARQLFLETNTTANGIWRDIAYTNLDVGATLTLGREPWHITVSSTSERGFDCLDYIRKHGYQDVNPVALVVTVQPNVVIGGYRTDRPSFTTQNLVAGSTCLLINHGIITGRAGDGGRGGGANVPLGGEPPEPGGFGGFAVRFRCDAGLVNHGTIQGGGGGGGGGNGSATQGGGGGGGGAGLQIGVGGAAPFSGGGTAGNNGGVSLGGSGGTGANSGGSGGFGGAAGTAGGGGGAAGGAAGDAIRYKTGTTFTLIRTGTILGAQVSEA